MNGDLGKVYDVVNDIQVTMEGLKVRQEERHIENIKKFDTLFVKIEKVRDVDDIQGDVTRLQWIVFVVVILGILLKLT